MEAKVTNFGARLVSLLIPDKNGKMVDVVLGFGTLDEYLKAKDPYFGPTVGRFANRIANGRFMLDGKEFLLPRNNGPNTLHGGKKGFYNVEWDAVQPDSRTLILTYLSKDGEEGFPGNLKVKLTYSLTDDSGLKLEYEAVTDIKTVVNLTNHSYFNLNGEGSGKILDHLLQINADEYTPVDSVSIPLGNSNKVKDTPFDFRILTPIGQQIKADHIQLSHGKGYDHNFVLRGFSNRMKHAATVIGDLSGIKMDIYTEEPGLQFYSGNFMSGKNRLKNGSVDSFRSAFALETQHFPDSPNQPTFPSTVLNVGEKYHTVSVYKFSVYKSF